LIIFKDGKEVDRMVGAFPKHVLEGKIEALL
jgi:thioredoxin-like negative regulator of GroEL